MMLYLSAVVLAGAAIALPLLRFLFARRVRARRPPDLAGYVVTTGKDLDGRVRQ